MENKEIIPNVSCIFRQLVQVSNTNSRLSQSKKNQPYTINNNYSLNSHHQQISHDLRVDFVSNMGLDDRQKRHQQLMNKFKNSLEENRQLLGVNPSSIQREPISYNYQPYSQSYSQLNKPSNMIHSQTNSNTKLSNPSQSKKWFAPQLKYRHINDLEQTSITNKSHESHKNQSNHSFNQNQQKHPTFQNQLSQLRSQFYQSNFPNSNQNLQTKPQKVSFLKSNQNSQVQDEANIYQNSNEESINKLSRLSQKPSKYSENLQSYYELCRKPIKTSYIKQKTNNNAQSKMNNQKFIRKQVPKIEGINLQKAMKILSLDD